MTVALDRAATADPASERKTRRVYVVIDNEDGEPCHGTPDGRVLPGEYRPEDAA